MHTYNYIQCNNNTVLEKKKQKLVHIKPRVFKIVKLSMHNSHSKVVSSKQTKK